MGQTRRNFLKLAGAAGLGAAAAPGALKAAQKARTVAARDNPGPKELPRNMTFCTLRRDGRYVLGIRTQRGVLDVEKAAKALKRTAPSTIDEVLQGVDGAALKSLVDAALANGAAKAAFVPEEQGPFGPWLVTADQIPNVQKLGLQTRVNGELRQNSNTDDMIFDVATIISYTSQVWTLKPGDIFFTGTPEGVILGKPEAQQVWLKPGDVVVTSIEKLGDLRITLAAQQ